MLRLLVISLSILATCTTRGTDAPVCATNGCISDAEMFRDAIDKSQDACDDFYQYACGKWMKTNKIPDDQKVFNMFTLMDDKIEQRKKELLEDKTTPNLIAAVTKRKALYRECMETGTINKEKLEPIVQFFSSAGLSLPMMKKDWPEKKYRFSKELLNYKKNGLATFLYFDVGAYKLNPKINKIYVGTTLLLSQGSKKFYEDPKKTDMYRNFLMKLFKALNPKKNHIHDVNDIVEYEIKGSKLLPDVGEINLASDVYREYNLTGENAIDDQLPKVKRRKLLIEPYVRELIEGSDIKIPDRYIKTVQVHNYKQMYKNAEYILNTRKRTLATKVALSALAYLKDYLPQNIRDIYDEYAENVYSVTAKPRWKQCLGHMSLAEARLYLDEYFTKSNKESMSGILKSISRETDNRLKNNDWMDNSTKEEARKKLKKMKDIVGYEDWLMNDQLLNNYYKKVDIKAGKGLESYVAVLKAIFDSNVKSLLQKGNERQAIEDPTAINAYYYPAYNKIVLLAGLLSPPFFQPETIPVVNYAAIGIVIGHEIAHGFDINGREYDSQGALKDWWSKFADENYKKKAECIIDQYDKYLVPGIKKKDGKVNGNFTLGENYGDIVGVWTAYQAYHKTEQIQRNEKLHDLPYTQKQLFFLSYARLWCANIRKEYQIENLSRDPHAPYRWRVNGPLIGHKEFATAFKCAKGTRMYPDPKDFEPCTF